MKMYFTVLLMLLDYFTASMSFCALTPTLLLLLIGHWSEFQIYIDGAF